MRMKTILFGSVAAALFGVAASALASDIFDLPTLFPGNGQYVAANPIDYSVPGVGPVTVSDLDLTQLQPTTGGDFPAKSFFDVFVDITIPSLGTSPIPGIGTGATDTIVQRGGSDTGTFNTQMTQLDISGLPGGAEIRIDPNTPSTGQTTVTDNGGGMFRITSFFDIFTDISLDGGSTWTPATGPDHLTLQPSVPDGGATLPMLLLPFTLLALGAYRQKVRPV